MDIQFLISMLPTVLTIIGAAIVLRLLSKANFVVYVNNDEIGILERMWSSKGSVENGFIALNGEAGFRPDVLRGGFHMFFPYMYRVHRQKLVVIPQGTIGYVFARGGKPLAPGQVLGTGKHKSPTFEDAEAFLTSGGQRGPQRTILREGLYAINTAQFVVFTIGGTQQISLGKDDGEITQMRKVIEERSGFTPVVVAASTIAAPKSPGQAQIKAHAVSVTTVSADDAPDLIGIVTVHDGPSLDAGEIIAPMVDNAEKSKAGHCAFQDPDAFLDLGGRRGRQEQVLVDGTYMINRMFATIELSEKTTVEIGKVGVVVSYTGGKGEDTTDASYRYGELVDQGNKGVWKVALQPGRYPLNPYALRVVSVPTTNFVLRWVKERAESHGFDANLSEVKLITKDAFEPVLPLSIVLHIAYDKAPLVVQRFGDVRGLVEQTLDPMVSAYFKDAAQGKTLIELIQNRSELQAEALRQMQTRFAEYNLDCKEVMLGTPRAQPGDTHMATIFDQLRDRQVAVEKLATYEHQRAAADKSRELKEAEATAANQADLTKSKIDITVRENKAKADLAAAQQAAEATKVTAAAAGEQVRIAGAAEAARIEAIGKATAESTKAQVDAFGGPEFQLAKEVATILQGAITGSKVPLVPQIAVTDGGGSGQGGGAVGALTGLVLAQLAKTGALPVAKPLSADGDGPAKE